VAEHVSPTDGAVFMDVSDGISFSEESDYNEEHNNKKDALRRHIKNLRSIIRSYRSRSATTTASGHT
jgi:hypothetical protein